MVTPLDLCQNVFAFQFHYLQGYYQALLVTGVALLTVVEVVRLYLGYAGNLREKVIQSSPVSASLIDLWIQPGRCHLRLYLHVQTAIKSVQTSKVLPNMAISPCLIRCQHWQPSGSCRSWFSCQWSCSSWQMKRPSSSPWREPFTPFTSSSCSPRSWPRSGRSGKWPRSSPCSSTCASLAGWTVYTTRGSTLCLRGPITASSLCHLGMIDIASAEGLPWETNFWTFTARYTGGDIWVLPYLFYFAFNFDSSLGVE